MKCHILIDFELCMGKNAKTFTHITNNNNISNNDGGILFLNFTAKTSSCRLFVLYFFTTHSPFIHMLFFVSKWMGVVICSSICIRFNWIACLCVSFGFMAQNVAIIHCIRIGILSFFWPKWRMFVIWCITQTNSI